MNDAGEKDENRPDEGESIPTSSSGPGTVGLGEQIGRYKLLRILGEGGFGIVYLAEQQRPMKRQVALKIIKPGMDSAQVIRRFEAERQALALLDHPNVAHVYDAGTTELGRPYFVMEYVKGVPITEHCDRQRLTIEERLKLFVKVCEAIQHAHQKGIIHRDIKPSNIQVCIQDEQAVPKVIDFGVAKALSQPLTERTLVTEQGQLIGTPEYISPEQAEMTNQDIDTRSDIYSLGVVLYELLTGTLPFESATLRRGSLEQMRQVLRKEEPKTPSTRVGTLDAEASTRLIECFQSDAATLRRKLHGDLDWITLKAMEKDRMRRYQTAHALAEDIERHLNNEPVLAGRPGTLYRFQKLVRRNRGVFTAAAVVAVVLVLGAIVSTWQAVRATRAEHEQSRLREDAVAAQEKETAQRRKAEALAYASDISLAQQALAMNDLGRARQLLDDHRPRSGEADLRGWEWRYLWQECQSDALGELCRYPNSAYSVSYSRDGKLLAVAGIRQYFVDVWDMPGRKRIIPLQPKEGHLVAFSPRDDLLATDAEKQIRLWRTGTWDLAAQLPVAGNVSVLRFSRDGRRLASEGYPGRVTVWETDRWTEICRIDGITTTGWQGVLDFSPDGKAVVLACVDRHLRVFDLASGNADISIPEAHPELITAVAWSPTGSVIASGSGYNGGPIRLWDAATGTRVGDLEGHTGYMCQLLFSKDGKRLYSAAGDHTIRIWDVGQRRCLATLRGSTHEVYGIALSPDGILASACKDGVIALWSAVPQPEVELPRIATGGLPAFSPDSRVLAVPRKEGTVSLLDLATLREIEPLPALGTSGIFWLAYSPDGTLLILGTYDGRIGVWSCAEHRLLRELEGHKESIIGLFFRTDGTRLLSADGKGNVIVWDTHTWQRALTTAVELAGMGAISPDGRLGAIGAPGEMRWFNGETGGSLPPTSGPPGPPWPAARVVFSGDGSRVATVSTYGTVAIWDPSSFKLLTAFRGHAQGTHGVTFSPDGRRLATGGGTGRDAVKLWDLSTDLSTQPPRLLIILPGKGSLFGHVLFSPDGQWLAAICRTELTFDLWRAPSWAEIEAEEKKMESGQSP